MTNREIELLYRIKSGMLTSCVHSPEDELAVINRLKNMKLIDVFINGELCIAEDGYSALDEYEDQIKRNAQKSAEAEASQRGAMMKEFFHSLFEWIQFIITTIIGFFHP